MAYEEIGKTVKREHVLTVRDRERLNVSGVEDVSGFDDGQVVLSTVQGELTIRGQGLHIERIDLDAGELEVKGHVQELSYNEPALSGSLWSRLFG